MKSLKIMSILGLVWFGLSLICILAFINSDVDASAGWGFLAVIYAIPLSIVALVKSNKKY